MSSARGCATRLRGRLASIVRVIYDSTPPIATVRHRLTAIAQAVYEFTPINHLVRGASKPVLAISSFLSNQAQSPKTRVVLQKLTEANLVKYLAPAVMMARFFQTLTLKLPESESSTLGNIELAMSILVLGRLMIRALVRNAAYTQALSKVVPEDLNQWLSQEVSERIVANLRELFGKIYPGQDEGFEKNYQLLAGDFKKSFIDFYSKKITKDSLKKDVSKYLQQFLTFFPGDESYKKILREEIANICMDELTHFNYPNVPQFAKIKFDDALGHTITEADAIAEAEFSEKKLKQRTKTREKIPSLPRAITLSTNLSDQMKQLRNTVHHLLPANHIESCKCPDAKKNHAVVSNPMYFAAINLLTSIPEMIELILYLLELQARPLRTLINYTKYFTFVLRALLYGQSLTEAQFNEVGLCTAHRYSLVAKNKMSILGKGLGFLFIVEVAGQLLKRLVNVDNLFTRDAITQFLLALYSIAAAFKEPLPGQAVWAVDIFMPARKGTQLVVWGLKSWLSPNLEDQRERHACIEGLKIFLGSSKLHGVAFLLLGPSEMLPNAEIAYLFSKVRAQQPNAWVHPEGLDDHPVKVFTNVDAVRMVLQLNKESLKKNLEWVDFVKNIAQPLYRVLSVLPIQSAFISFISLPLQLLQEDAFADVMEMFKKAFLQIRFTEDMFSQDMVEVIFPEQKAAREVKGGPRFFGSPPSRGALAAPTSVERSSQTGWYDEQEIDETAFVVTTSPKKRTSPVMVLGASFEDNVFGRPLRDSKDVESKEVIGGSDGSACQVFDIDDDPATNDDPDWEQVACSPSSRSPLSRYSVTVSRPRITAQSPSNANCASKRI